QQQPNEKPGQGGRQQGSAGKFNNLQDAITAIMAMVAGEAALMWHPSMTLLPLIRAKIRAESASPFFFFVHHQRFSWRTVPVRLREQHKRERDAHCDENGCITFSDPLKKK